MGEAVRHTFQKPFKSDALKNLRTGQFYVYGWFEQPLLVDVTGRRLTRHGGDTPLITQIQRSRKQQASIEEFRHTIEVLLQKKKSEADEMERKHSQYRFQPSGFAIAANRCNAPIGAHPSPTSFS